MMLTLRRRRDSDSSCFRMLVVFNPTEQFRTSVISVFIDSPDANVVEAETGLPVDAQISAVWAEPSRASTQAFQVRNSLAQSSQECCCDACFKWNVFTFSWTLSLNFLLCRSSSIM